MSRARPCTIYVTSGGFVRMHGGFQDFSIEHFNSAHGEALSRAHGASGSVAHAERVDVCLKRKVASGATSGGKLRKHIERQHRTKAVKKKYRE